LARAEGRISARRRQLTGIPRWVAVLLLGIVALTVLGAVVLERSRLSEASVGPPSVLGSSVVARFAALAPASVPVYLAIEQSGTLFVGSRLQSSVLRFDANGQPLDTWGPRLDADIVLHDVAGLASIGSDLFVVDGVDHRIIHLDATGRPVGGFSFDSAGTYGAGALAVDSEGKLYLADTGLNRVLVFGADGALVRTIGASGPGVGQLRQPVALAFAPDGLLYVADLENRRIAWWYTDGTPGGAWPTGFPPWGVTVDLQGRVYVPEVDARRVHVYSADGAELSQIDETASIGAVLSFPSQALIGRSGSPLWVLGQDGLLKFDLQTEAAPPRPISVPSVGLLTPAVLAVAAGVIGVYALRSRWRPKLASALGVVVPRSGTASLLLGAAAWCVALGVALVGQFEVASGRPIEQARPFYVGAAVLALVGVWLLERGLTPTEQITVPAEQTGPAGRRSTGVMLLGTALMLSAVPLTVVHLYTVAAAVWLSGLYLLIVGAALANVRLHSWIRPRLNRSQLVEVVGVLGVTLCAFVLRFVDLVNLPPQVHGDEAAVGIAARKLLTGQADNLFGLGWYEIPNPSFGVPAAFMRIFGDDLFGLRTASVCLGTLTVLLTYLLVRQMFTSRVAIVAAALLAVAEIHIHYSRIGVTYMQAGCATVLLLYLLLRALRRRRMTDYVLLGLAGGLCLVVYAAAQMAPVLVVLYIGHAILRDRGFVRVHARGLALAAAAGVLFFAPMTVAYAGQLSAFNSRAAGISILGHDGLQHELSAYGVGSLDEVLRLQVQKTLEGFIATGETSDQYGHRAPLVDVWTGALLVVGVGGFALRLRDPRYFLLATWLWMTLLFGSVLTVDAPFSPRLVGMLPLLAIFPAIFVETGWKAAEQLGGCTGRMLMGSAAAAVVGLALVANVRDYTQVHVVQFQPAGFATVLSHYVSDINDRYHVYLISRPDTSLGYDTTRFLVPDLDGTDLRDGPLPSSPPPSGKGMAFIVEGVMPDFSARLEQVQQRYPAGLAELHRSSRGDLLFASVLVDP
jgi:4-amino-4-deoxy-L-arabinose transferase-like glycosyltransferase